MLVSFISHLFVVKPGSFQIKSDNNSITRLNVPRYCHSFSFPLNHKLSMSVSNNSINHSMHLDYRLTQCSPMIHLPNTSQNTNTFELPYQSAPTSFLNHSKDQILIKELSWNESKSIKTMIVKLSPHFTLNMGYFTANLEFFVLSGSLQIGDYHLTKHCYSNIPIKQLIGDWSTGEDGVELLWMENGSEICEYVEINLENTEEISEVQGLDEDLQSYQNTKSYLPIVDSTLMSWQATQTSMFENSKKKWQRKENDSGVWLLHVFPQYQSMHQLSQLYNEEAFILSGGLTLGDEYYLTQGFHSYAPFGSIVPRHESEFGCLAFFRVDRDLSNVNAVSLVREEVKSQIDRRICAESQPFEYIPMAFKRHIGVWEGEYVKMNGEGQVTDRHQCKLEIGVHGDLYSQKNTYLWRNEMDEEVKREELYFEGHFVKSGDGNVELRVYSERIEGFGKVVGRKDEMNESIVFYGKCKAKKDVDCYDLIRIADDGMKRWRTWQVMNGRQLLEIVSVTESRTSAENDFFIPRNT
mmetsp:Transcript_3022/g.5351  ORF Transcript_3022/g.5351 Transcript_3022/m.5351 type:complete len:524 (-) Transcript_3022:146-1717(-)